MSTFFDEIQKQYENAQQRTQNALATGVNMIGRKGEMMNQMFNNMMNVVGQHANILSSANQVPLQLSGMFANMIDNETARKMQQEQFNKSYNLDKGRLALQNKYQQAQLDLDTKLKNKQISEIDYERGLAKSNAEYVINNLTTQYPQAKERYMQLKQQFPKASETQIAGWLESEGQAGKFTPVLSSWDRMWSGDESVMPQNNKAYGRTR